MNIISTKLSTLLYSLNSQALLLPEIQRDFVWTRPRIIALLDSLFHGFPIGAMLVWKTSSNIQVKPSKSASKAMVNLKTMGEVIHGYLLDGQQRLTALLIVLNNELPIRFHLINGSFEIEKRKHRMDPLFLPLYDVLNEKIQVGDLLKELKDKKLITEQNTENLIVKNYLEVRLLLDRNIAVLEYTSDHYADATKLFIRFNSGGVKLRKSELAIAELARHAPSLVTDHIRTFSTRWADNGYAFTIPFITKCLAVIKTKSVRFIKPEETWEGTKQELLSYWNLTRKAIEKTIKFLGGTMHWDSSSWLSSYNALIPIVYILAKRKDNKQLTDQENRMLRKWLASVTIRGRYSGSSDTKLDSDIKKINSRYSVKQLWSILSEREKKKITKREIEEASRSGPIMSIYYSMLKEKGARDWVNSNKIDGTILGYNSSLEVHHIFPRSKLSEKGWDSEWVNTFANYALIQKGSNIELSNKLPDNYLGTDKKFTSQCIPREKKLWKLDSYERFLKNRTLEIQLNMNTFLSL